MSEKRYRLSVGHKDLMALKVDLQHHLQVAETRHDYELWQRLLLQVYKQLYHEPSEDEKAPWPYDDHTMVSKSVFIIPSRPR